ncbi:hydrogenase maturation protein HypF [Pseudorhodoferax sp. Leaf267]|nr:hydrogenase maturation protein HypF [Pseudorhodoferax sp. Leaf267]
MATVLALGAWLKNRACRLDGAGLHWSALHGDLQDADACRALEKSAHALVAGARPDAIAHDLHPDLYSTQLAQALAAQWGVPAIGVQHHHAHIAAVLAEHALDEPVIGLALDGVGLGDDGGAWGGELLRVEGARFERLGHLWPLALPGGDAAARAPWRALAAALHAMGRGDAIEPLLAPQAGATAARTVRAMLDQGLNCPPSSSAGRWFDAAAAALRIAPLRQAEAEAAIALEQAAARHTGALPLRDAEASCGQRNQLDLRALLAELLAWAPPPDEVPQAAAWFHDRLAQGLARWALHAAHATGCRTVCLGGGCFLNALLTQGVTHRLQAAGLRVLRPIANACGDAGLAWGQAWVAARRLTPPAFVRIERLPSCA